MIIINIIDLVVIVVMDASAEAWAYLGGVLPAQPPNKMAVVKA